MLSIECASTAPRMPLGCHLRHGQQYRRRDMILDDEAHHRTLAHRSQETDYMHVPQISSNQRRACNAKTQRESRRTHDSGRTSEISSRSSSSSLKLRPNMCVRDGANASPAGRPACENMTTQAYDPQREGCSIVEQPRRMRGSSPKTSEGLPDWHKGVGKRQCGASFRDHQSHPQLV